MCSYEHVNKTINTMLKEKYEKAVADLKVSETLVLEKDKALETASDEVTSLKSDLESAKTSEKEAKDELAVFTKENEKLENSIKDLTEKVEASEKEVKTLSENIEEKAQEIATKIAADSGIEALESANSSSDNNKKLSNRELQIARIEKDLGL